MWVFSVIFTLAFVYYQRQTGPTYPVTVKTEMDQQLIKNRLIRTWECGSDAGISLRIPDTSVNGYLQYKRYNSYDAWFELRMERVKDSLIAYLPDQPPAGKMEYRIFLERSGIRTPLTVEPIVLRYKGAVPDWILFIHILLIFSAMLLSTRTGLEALINGNRIVAYTRVTLILLLVGGLIFGPVIQKYAFDAFWTGWPLGDDLTDNKTLVAFIFWLIAFIQQQRNHKSKVWIIIAAVVLVIIFLIPHSMWGSELNYMEQ
jgi:hypothetical protein